MDTPTQKNQPTSDTPSLGKLKQLGPESWWQTALMLPKSWDDLRIPVDDFSRLEQMGQGEHVLINGVVGTTPSTSLRNGQPRLRVFIDDPRGHRIAAIFFGDTTGIALAAGQSVTIAGKIKAMEKMIFLNEPEFVDPVWIGRLRPRYQGKPRVIKPETVRDKLMPGLRENALKAAKVLLERLYATDKGRELAAGCGVSDPESLAAIIRTAHVPRSPQMGQRAITTLETLTAGIRLIEADDPDLVQLKKGLPIGRQNVESTLAGIPFELDEDQYNCVMGIARKLQGTTPMRAMLSGDVGSGKTAVFAAIAETVAIIGGRVVIMAPSAPLAEQTLEKFTQWWPRRETALVTSDSDKDAQALQSAQILVGSTALLFHEIGPVDLVIVDEQQRFSRAQREQLIGDGGCHLIEATATCIPRSMALVQLGHWDVYRIRGKHVEKNITTRLLEQSENEYARDLLFADISATVRGGRQVLIVYPMKETDDAGKDVSERDKRKSVEGAAAHFEKLFPGRTRTIVGSDSETDKARVLQDMNSKAADILVATTVIEVGIDIQGLQRVAVVCPERLGLMQLHQIRGRVGRGGGEAYMDLYAPEPLSDKARQRLQVLVEETDGFEIADRDMRLRGTGDISRYSQSQKGSDEGLLFGYPLPIEALERASDLIDERGGS